MPKKEIKKDRSIIGLHGQTGSGKTLHAKRHVIPLFKRVIILDTQGEYDYLITENIASFQTALQQNYDKKSFVLCYRPLDDKTNGFFILAANTIDTCIVVDEIGYYSTPHSLNPDLNKIVQYGRHFCQSLVYLSRRPGETNRNITSQASTIISFRQIEPIDLQYFKQIMPDATKLSDLARYKYPEEIQENKHFIFVRGKEEFEELKQTRRSPDAYRETRTEK